VSGTYYNNSTSTSANHDLKLEVQFPAETDAGSPFWAVPFNVTGAVVATNGRSHQWILVEREQQIYKLHVDYTKSRYSAQEKLISNILAARLRKLETISTELFRGGLSISDFCAGVSLEARSRAMTTFCILLCATR